MTSQPAADRPSTTDNQIAEVRSLLAAADRRLLGDTISLADDQWRAASLLPGWSRGHVATHIARHGEAFARLAKWARTGVEQQMYPGDRDADIEAGAGRSGLEIQTDLDTTAGLLAEAFDVVSEAGAWNVIVRLRNGQDVPARALPAGRLTEVCVHHLDLGIGLTATDIDQRSAEIALGWCASRLSRRQDYPRLRVTTESGTAYDFGSRDREDPIAISGPANRLLGWITGRCDAEGLQGQIPELPSFG